MKGTISVRGNEGNDFLDGGLATLPLRRWLVRISYLVVKLRPALRCGSENDILMWAQVTINKCEERVLIRNNLFAMWDHGNDNESTNYDRSANRIDVVLR